jgi:hypothetical protein
MWGFVTCWWDLSNMGGRVCHIWVGFVKCGGVCQIWAGFVKYGRDLSSFGVCHFFGGICQIWAGFVTGFVTKSGEKPQKVPISDKPRDKSHNISILVNKQVAVHAVLGPIGGDKHTEIVTESAYGLIQLKSVARSEALLWVS